MTNMNTLPVATIAMLLLVTACSPEAPTGAQQGDAGADALSSVQATELERHDTLADGVAEGGYCSLDTVNQQPVGTVPLKVGDEAVFVGWAGDSAGQVSKDTRLVLSGEAGIYTVAMHTRIDRPDVVQALNQPGLVGSGFAVSTVLAVEPGAYRISALTGAAPAEQCQFDVELTIAAR